MYGNPSFFDTHHTFYGAVHYEIVHLESEGGIVVSLGDVVAIRKFQSFITQASYRCAGVALSGPAAAQHTTGPALGASKVW